MTRRMPGFRGNRPLAFDTIDENAIPVRHVHRVLVAILAATHGNRARCFMVTFEPPAPTDYLRAPLGDAPALFDQF